MRLAGPAAAHGRSAVGASSFFDLLPSLHLLSSSNRLDTVNSSPSTLHPPRIPESTPASARPYFIRRRFQLDCQSLNSLPRLPPSPGTWLDFDDLLRLKPTAIPLPDQSHRARPSRRLLPHFRRQSRRHERPPSCPRPRRRPDASQTPTLPSTRQFQSLGGQKETETQARLVQTA